MAETLTLEEVKRLEEDLRAAVQTRGEHFSVDVFPGDLRLLLSLARAHLEAREGVGELVERLRNPPYVTRPSEHHLLEEMQGAADALTALQAELISAQKATLAQRHRAQDAEAEVLAKDAEISALKADNERLRKAIAKAGVSLDQGMSKEGVSAQLREALEGLLADCDEYVRINNLFDEKGRPASNHAMERARAALGKDK